MPTPKSNWGNGFRRFPQQRRDWAWALLFLLLAGARLFESGLSLDPTIYAVISRNLAVDGELWSLHAGKYFFPEFYEHPFFAFWLQALIFKVLGASDVTARLLGLLTGALTGLHLFRLGRRLGGEKFADAFCLLTALSVPFVGRMATFYLEIPLLWLAVACLDTFYLALDSRSLRAWGLSGLYLGLAFLTKGLAALPLPALLAVIVLAERGWKGAVEKGPWLVVAVGTAVTTAFLILQSSFGRYSFWDGYLSVTLFRKVLRPLGWRDFTAYFFEFFRLHPVHLLLAAAVPWVVPRPGRFRRPIVFGAAGFLLFGLANASLGKIYYHYFYPLFPFVNGLAALTFDAGWPRVAKPVDWWKAAFRFALFYLVVWNFLPVPLRKKPWVDFFELQGHVQALKESGLPELEGLGVKHADWIYAAMSLWYWEIPTRHVAAADELGAAAVLTEGASPDALGARGYVFCAASRHYVLWVRPERHGAVCERQGLKERYLR